MRNSSNNVKEFKYMEIKVLLLISDPLLIMNTPSELPSTFYMLPYYMPYMLPYNMLPYYRFVFPP